MIVPIDQSVDIFNVQHLIVSEIENMKEAVTGIDVAKNVSWLMETSMQHGVMRELLQNDRDITMNFL